jgi:hypothetical protein
MPEDLPEPLRDLQQQLADGAAVFNGLLEADRRGLTELVGATAALTDRQRQFALSAAVAFIRRHVIDTAAELRRASPTLN